MIPRGTMDTVDFDREREEAAQRRRQKNLDRYWPRWLLHEAPIGATRAELREVAGNRWTTLEAAKLDYVVDRAVELRQERGARIDPKEVDGLRHPAVRENAMASVTRGRLRAWLRKQLAADPEISNDELEKRAKTDLGPVSRRSLGQNARIIRDELDAGDPAKVEPEPPQEPSAGDAEPEPELAPATEPVEAREEDASRSTEPGGDHAEPVSPAPAQGSGIAEPAPAQPGGLPVTRGRADAEFHEEPARARPTFEARGHYRGSVSIGRRNDLVQVEIADDGRARLFVDLDDLPPALAYRLAAELQLRLADAREAA